MARVVNFAARGRSRMTGPTSQHDQLRLQDAANLIQALAMVTDARETFLKFADEAQTPAALAMYVRLAHELQQSATEIRALITRTGDDEPPRCA